jgi:beta-aspartyl-peptidase (threonine type)
MMRSLVIMNGEATPGIGRAVDLLRNGASPLDVVEESIKIVESDPSIHTVGYNSPPNALGVMQLDASCMNGDTLETGAVGALEGIVHPISVAREMMKRLPHVMLVGAGAQQFAKECGFEQGDSLTPEAKAAYEAWKVTNRKEPLVSMFNPTIGIGSHGTVICLVRSAAGSFGGGISTSGWDYKYPGRLGDSPVIGAGLYVDSRYGGAACTHCGENAIRTSLARSVVLYMKKGATVREAVAEGMEDLKGLKGGFQGQVVIYATDKDGDYFIARRLQDVGSCMYYVWRDDMPEVAHQKAEYLGT